MAVTSFLRSSSATRHCCLSISNGKWVINKFPLEQCRRLVIWLLCPTTSAWHVHVHVFAFLPVCLLACLPVCLFVCLYVCFIPSWPDPTIHPPFLCSNSIGIKGAEALASYLMEVDNLQSLRLTSNRICDDGAIAMASVSVSTLLVCVCVCVGACSLLYVVCVVRQFLIL